MVRKSTVPTMPSRGAQQPFRLAIVAASARAAAVSAVQAGYDAVAADLFADADLQRICPATRIENYPDALVDWLAQTPCHGWMYVGALENRPDLVDRLATIRPLLGVGGEPLRAVRDPLQLQDALRNVGLNFPRTQPTGAAMPRRGRWLRKTYRGSSGVGVSESVGVSVGDSDAYWQQQVGGTPIAALFVGTGRQAVLYGASTQWVGEPCTGAARFQYCGSVAPLIVSESIDRELQRIGSALTQAFELRGLFGVDLMLRDQELWLLEVNPRYTASAEACERAGAGSAIAAHVAACQDGTLPPPSAGDSKLAAERAVQVTAFAGKAILFAQRRLEIDPATCDALLRAAGDSKRPGLADIPAPGSAIQPGQPVLTALVDGQTPEAVRSSLRSQLDRARTLLYDTAPPQQ